MSTSPERKHKSFSEVESVVNRSLKNENDVLRCQLNDLIAREKNQRVELQRLRQHRDAEVASLVQAGTTELAAEVEQLKAMVQSTSGQLLQAVSEWETVRKQKEECNRALKDTRQDAAAQENRLTRHLHSLEEAVCSGASIVDLLADNIEAFQRHVLPTFKPAPANAPLEKTTTIDSHHHEEEIPQDKVLAEKLTRLQNGIALLRVIVDAKNDTLVLIRGKLKQENDELYAELQSLKGSKERAPQSSLQYNVRSGEKTKRDQSSCAEKLVLKQELQNLQSLFNEEVKQLKSKLKTYECEEQQGQGMILQVQRELASLQEKLNSVESSRSSLEASLKEESSSRSQLVSQIFTLRKDNDKTKAELETLKLSQKFLARQPSSGYIPEAKMELMNTVNQLLSELNKVKGEKVALEEELKVQRRSQVRDRMKQTVTGRDVQMAASNKVGDNELALKLTRARLEQFKLQDNCGTPPSSSSRSPLISDMVASDILQGCVQPPSCIDLPSSTRDKAYKSTSIYGNTLSTRAKS